MLNSGSRMASSKLLFFVISLFSLLSFAASPAHHRD